MIGLSKIMMYVMLHVPESHLTFVQTFGNKFVLCCKKALKLFNITLVGQLLTEYEASKLRLEDSQIKDSAK